MNKAYVLGPPVMEGYSLDLSNTEKQMLRSAAEPDGPLWKILMDMVRYREGLKESLAGADLTDPEQVRSALKVQSNIVSIAWLVEKFESALTIEEEEEKS